MFSKEYSFYGKHADMVKFLTSKVDSKSSFKFFERNIDVYILAPIIGFLYGRKSTKDDTSVTTTKIFPEQLIKETIQLKYNYQLIMLIDQKNEPLLENRIDKAFRYYGGKEGEKDKNLFEEYVLGGVEVLYEKVTDFGKAITIDDYVNNLYDFLEEFHERYNFDISDDFICDLCSVAR